MNTATLELVIRLRDEATNQLQGLKGTIRSVGSTLQTAMIAGAAAAGAAVVGFSAMAISEFSGFERQMNEVFTLLPGITADAMDDMSSEVLALSRSMGVLPEEVVPALYQSLSAGVPSDNVFDFLERANQAAVAGVADLETSVDVLSTLTNTYGEDMLNTAQASDILFTTVRLGKTDFNQLASSLSNVLPVAASTSTEFEEVGAAMAVMTARGVPTAQATTQLRQLLVELSKSGTKVAGVFEDVAGVGFREFQEQGGNVGDALQLLQQHADENNIALSDLFGSVEAGGAALLLAADGGEAFASALAEQQDAAGATDAAFEQMDQGIGRSMDRIKATLSAATIQVGERLAPAFSRVATIIAENLPRAVDGLVAAFDAVAPTLTAFVNTLSYLFLAIQEGQNPLVILNNAIFSLLSGLGVSSQTITQVQQAVVGLAQQFADLVGPVVAFIQNNVQMRDVLTAVGVLIASVVVPALVGIVAAALPIIAAFAAIVAAVAALRTAWETNFGGIREIVAAVVDRVSMLPQQIGAILTRLQQLWAEHGDAVLNGVRAAFSTVLGAFSTAMEAVRSAVSSALAILRQWWAEHGDNVILIIQTALNTVVSVVTNLLDTIRSTWATHQDTVKGMVQAAWDALTSIIQIALDTIGNIIDATAAAIQGDWDTFADELEAIWDTLWATIQTILQTAWDTITTLVGTLISEVLALFNNTDWGGIGSSIVSGIAGGISAGAGMIADAARNAARNAFNAALSFLNAGSPSKLFEVEVGLGMMQGWAQGIEQGMQMVTRRTQQAAEAAFGAVFTTPYMQGGQLFAPPLLRPSGPTIDSGLLPFNPYEPRPLGPPQIHIFVDARGANMSEEAIREVVRNELEPALLDVGDRVDTAWRVGR